MRHESAATAAALLAAAWRQGHTLTAIPPECRPRTAADGYRVQDLLAAELGFPVDGWKIGGTSAVARRLLKARGPFAGRIFTQRVFPSGVTLPASDYRVRGLEGEFAFRLKHALPPRRRTYAEAEVSEAVGALHPAIEVVESRFDDFFAVGVPSVVADLGSNGALILGRAVPRWRRLALEQLAVRMVADERVVGKGTGADCLGHPLKALTWLANLLRSRGGLKAGLVVSTGTCTGLYRAQQGERVRADFGRLGAVDLTFTN